MRYMGLALAVAVVAAPARAQRVARIGPQATLGGAGRGLTAGHEGLGGDSMTTRLDQELAEQRRWKPRPDRRGTAIFDILVRNEFEGPRRCASWQRQSLAAAIAHAFAHVPYYRELARRLGLAPEDVARLPGHPPGRLPVPQAGGEGRLGGADARGVGVGHGA